MVLIFLVLLGALAERVKVFPVEAKNVAGRGLCFFLLFPLVFDDLIE